jgi:hypothetical protein
MGRSPSPGAPSFKMPRIGSLGTTCLLVPFCTTKGCTRSSQRATSGPCRAGRAASLTMRPREAPPRPGASMAWR